MTDPTSTSPPSLAGDRPRPGRFARSTSARSTRVPSRVLIAVLYVVLAGIGIALFQSVGAERAAREQVALTTDVLRNLRTALRLGLDAETGQRGFLLTNDPAYLAPYERGAREWLGAIDALDRSLEGIATEGQAAAIERMRGLATAKLDEFARTIELARSGRRDEALALVASDEGQGLMNSFREEVAALEDEEQLILSAALARAELVEARTLPILAFLALAVIGLVVLGLWLERRTALAEAEAREADELRRARERSDLLTRELNHRVKNLFAVILSIVAPSGRGATDVKDLVRKIRERIHALSLAHAVSQGQLDQKLVGLRDVLAATLEPYIAVGSEASDDASAAPRVALQGPAVELPVRSVKPIGLVAHELATNAAKYGALSVPEGRVVIEWTLEGREEDAVGAGENGTNERMVRLRWTERDGPATSEPAHSGFGSIMLRQAASQLRGTVERRWTPDGLVAEIAFPLPDAADVSPGAPPPSEQFARPPSEGASEPPRSETIPLRTSNSNVT